MGTPNLKAIKSDLPSFPLNFSVQTYNDNDLSPVIYIENLANAHDLQWAITNQVAEMIYLQPLSGAPSIENFHFQLKFRAGTLSENFISNPTPIFTTNQSTVTWAMNVTKDPVSKIVYVSLLAQAIPNDKLVLNPNEPLKIYIDKVNADPIGGARNTNVEFRYQNILNSDNVSNQLSGNRMQHLGVINHDGSQHVNMLLEVQGMASILNNGAENTLNIQLSNSTAETIAFSTDIDNPTKFELLIPTQFGDQVSELFLTSLSHAEKIEIEWGDPSQWEPPIQSPTDNSVTWTFTNKSLSGIGGGKSLNFKMKKIVSDTEVGTAKIFLNYFNIPGYWDGSLSLDIEKSPLRFKDKHVGIDMEAVENAYLNVPYPIGDNLNGIVIGDASKLNKNGSYDPSAGLAIVFAQSNHWPLVVLDDKGDQIFSVDQTGSVTAKQFKDKTGDIMPKGAIIMWSGEVSEIPPGWALCDGNNGTPDLRDRFVLGGGGKSPMKTPGGSEEVTLSIEQMPAHKHNLVDPGHTHTTDFKQRESSTDRDDSSLPIFARDSDKYYNTNKSYTGITMDDVGGNKPFKIIPPYYPLCYIMKK